MRLTHSFLVGETESHARFRGAALLTLAVASCTGSGVSAIHSGHPAGAGNGSSSGAGGGAGTRLSPGTQAGSAAGQNAAGAGRAPLANGGSSGADDRSLQACTDPVGFCPAYSFGIWQMLLAAADFGADARLVAMGGQGVLVALADGSSRIALLQNPSGSSSDPPYSSWTVPSGGRRLIAVTEGMLSSIAPTRTLVALTCDEARVHCSILRGDLSQNALSPWQETELPSGFVPRGFMLDTADEPRAICVYGNGMLCLRNGWQPAIVPSVELQLNDVAFGPLWSLAVGDHGRWFKRERADSGTLGAWQEQAPLGDAMLSQVSVAGAGGVITGEGRTQGAVGRQSEFFACSPSSDLVALMLDPGGQGLADAVTGTGEVLQHAMVTPNRLEPYCAYQQLTLPSGVLQAGMAPCGASRNPRLLTEQALFGTNVCAHDQ